MKKFLLAAAAVAMIGSVSAKEALDTTAMDSLTAGGGKGGYGYCCNYGYGSAATAQAGSLAIATGHYSIAQTATTTAVITGNGYAGSLSGSQAAASSVGTNCGCSYSRK